MLADYDPENTIDPNYDNPFDNNLKRRSFIIKVYSIVFICICVTVVHVCLVLFYADVRNFLFQNFYIIWIALIAYTITSFVVSCCMFVLKQPIAGAIVLGILVESLSIICAVTTMYYETHIILLAAIGTAAIAFIITLVAIFVPFDLTKCTFMLVVMGILFIVFMLICVIINIFVYIPILQVIVAFVCVFVFSIYMLYTTQLVIGGKTYQLDEDDYIAGAVFLYIDIIMIFLQLLQIFEYCSS